MGDKNQVLLKEQYEKQNERLVKYDWKTNSIFADILESAMAWKNGDLSPGEYNNQRGVITSLFKFFVNFLGFVIGTILKYHAYTTILYIVFIVPTAFIFYKAGLNPPFYVYMSFLSQPLSGGIFGTIFTDLYLVINYNPLSSLILFLSLFPFGFFTLLLTRYPTLIIFTALNLLVILLSLIGNMEIMSFLNNPFSHESAISGIFMMSPVLFAMVSCVVFTFIFFVKDNIDLRLGVVRGMNNLGENEGNLIATFFGANNLDVPVSMRGGLGLAPGEKEPPKYRLPRFTSAKELYVFLIGIRFRIVSFALVYMISAWALKALEIKKAQTINLFTATESQKMEYFQTACIKEASNIFRSAEPFEALYRKSSSPYAKAPSYGLETKVRIMKMRTEDFFNSFYLQNHSGFFPICNSAIVDMYSLYGLMIKEYGVEAMRDQKTLNRSFQELLRGYNRYIKSNSSLNAYYDGRKSIIENPVFIPFVLESLHKMALTKQQMVKESKILKDAFDSTLKMEEEYIKGKDKR